MARTPRLLIVACALWPLGMGACDKSSESPSVEIAELDVHKAAELLSGGDAVALDANSESTREEYGVVPGATLLSSSSTYDVSVLPEDKSQQLIFYCANSWCNASDSAAERAAESGYRQVAVMPPGIEGWKEAGHETLPPSS